MTNKDFWQSIDSIITSGFNPAGRIRLEEYATEFITSRLLLQRFSSFEQYGCTKGGLTHVIATLLAGAEDTTDYEAQGIFGFKRELQQAAKQAERIETWARKAGVWIDDVDNTLSASLGSHIAEGGEAKVYDGGTRLVKTIGLDYYLMPVHALDRITLHNTYFPETALSVIGFGKDNKGEFKIIVEQPYIEGEKVTEEEIPDYLKKMGFTLRNPRNWTYSTPEVYLSDMHDENLLKSSSGTIFVIDCDIRLNTPDLRLGGIRKFSNYIVCNY